MKNEDKKQSLEENELSEWMHNEYQKFIGATNLIKEDKRSIAIIDIQYSSFIPNPLVRS